MTGFGRYEDTVDGMQIVVEIRAVNHRYYEYSSRLPRAYGYLDEKLKSYLQNSVTRGKVEVNIWIETVDCPGSEVIVNHSLVNGYVNFGTYFYPVPFSNYLHRPRRVKLFLDKTQVLLSICHPRNNKTAWSSQLRDRDLLYLQW